ncbi:hypothetical protein MSG34_06925 [Vibrio sp. 1CM2L]|uniref:hypothetical protein n=1 Tax=Vibrio sp. 1CM2L TaxID=2929166 RepID=UPI0020BDC73B|nr:hypothetical protein [Vibrio sp. 1CM2L]MCK8075883.1 hypothetical protein [Vibrio sp. 1CM2L]
MLKIMLKFFLLIPFVMYYPTQAMAIQINSMLIIADDNDSGIITITNTQNHRVFLNGLMSEIRVVDGEIERHHYDRSNIDKWKIDIRPARTIIDQGLEKDFKINLKCAPNCKREYDEVFKLSLIPTPYLGDDDDNHTVQMAVGFAPVFIAPGKEYPLDYSINNDEEKVTIHNKGESFIKVKLSSCETNKPKLSKTNCNRTVYVLAGRVLSLDLSEDMKGEELLVSLSTYKDKYVERVKLINEG